MTFKKYLLFFLGLTTLIFSQPQFEEIEDISPLTILSPSLVDQKTAKIKLQNGLEAYIISDPQARESAAALTVEAGSWNDPEAYPGTAHFLEHMLFMGTQKYPDENEMFKYIGDHGGVINAYTSTDHTAYMFTVDNDAYEGALDRFAQFFIGPLFKLSGVKKELKAVDQENDKNIENDFWREWMIFKETGNQNHPNYKFSTGNAKTLGTIPPATLKSWFDEHYSANKMHLVIYSNQNIDELKALVSNLFSPIKNTEEFSLPKEPLTSEKQKNKIIYIEPIKEFRLLTLQWEVPEDLIDDAATEMLCYYMSSKSEGTLYSVLENQGLIESLDVECERMSKHHGVFSIQLSMTNKGVKHIPYLIQSIYSTIAFVNQHPIPRHLYDEHKSMQVINYQFQSRQNTFKVVSSHARNMISSDLKSYPYSRFIMGDYSESHLEKLLSCLSPNEAVTFVMAPESLTGIAPEQKEQWLGGEYTIVDFKPSEIENFESAAPLESLAYAGENPFVPHNLNLIEQKDSVNDPKLVSNTQYGKLYYVPDQQFFIPESVFLISLKSPLLDGSANSTALISLFTYGLEKRLQPILSQGKNAGLFAVIDYSNLKLDLSVKGYSEKAPQFLEKILRNTKFFTPTIEEFNQSKESLASYLESQEMNLPIQFGGEALSNILYNDAPTSHQLLKQVNKITYEEFLNFSKDLLSQIYLEMLITGNITEESSLKQYEKILKIFSAQPYPSDKQIKSRILQLSNKEGPFQVNQHAQLQGNATLLVIEEGSATNEKVAAQKLVQIVLNEAFFDELRTKQQTGYIAYSAGLEKQEQLLHLFAVQSSTHYPYELLARFDLFLEEFLRDFSDNISPDRYENLKENLVSKIKKPAANLKDFALENFQLAFTYDGNFKRKEQIIQAIHELSYERFQKICTEFFSRKNLRRIAVLVEGKPTEDKFFKYNHVSQELLKQSGTYISSK